LSSMNAEFDGILETLLPLDLNKYVWITGNPIDLDHKFTVVRGVTSLSPESRARVYVSGPQGVVVNMGLKRLAGTAGHAHPGGPAGNATPSRVSLSTPYPQNVSVEFVAPIASGIIEMQAVVDGSAQNLSSHKFKVKVPNLHPLSSSNSLVLVGSTGAHPDNHYGTTSLNSKLRQLSVMFFNKFGIPIYVNDMSLEWGGLFDIAGHWSSPHLTHRAHNI
jgi:hypothetical protein